MTSSTPANPGKHNKDDSATRADAYSYWTQERVRFADLDLNGHVNNIAFGVYAESGRVAFLRHIGFWSVKDPSRQNVMAHFEIDYLQELTYPSDIRVGVRVLHIGRSSFQLGAGIFVGDHCMATTRSVQVRIDSQSKASIPLSDEERLTLQPYVASSTS